MKKINYNFGIVLNPSGSQFGGAQKRFTNLFQYLYRLYPENAYYFVSKELFLQIKTIFPHYHLNNVIVLQNLEISLFRKTLKGGIREETSGDELVPDDIYKQLIINKLSLWRKGMLFSKSFIKQYFLYRQIEKVRKENGIKVFMGVYCGILPLYFYLTGRKRKAGVIFSDMDSWFFNINEGDKNNRYKKFNSFNFGLEKSDMVDFLSPFIIEGVLERKVNLNKKSITITPGSFSDYSKCIPVDKNECIVSYAARIMPDKNPMLYLEAAKIIINKYPDVKFNLLGQGLPNLHNEINKFIELNDIKDRVFFGFHPNPPEIFAKSTIFVSVQTTNNYPSQSVLEAMACGNAIIASDVGDTRMFINDDVGLLIPLELNSLVNALEILINDKKYALRLGENAREFVLKNHTIEKCAAYYLDLFEKTRLKIESKSSI